MFLHKIVLLLFCHVLLANAKIPPEAYLNGTERIEYNNYTAESHHPVTEDGYILTLFRIPGGKVCKQLNGSVLIMHGLTSCGADWLFGGPTRSIAYLLADACYDVWLGNQRGNRYSSKHVTLDPVTDNKEFFDFSIDEVGLYDVPAMIDYILNLTGEESLFYIGHSQGTTDFFIMASDRPEYNRKIKLAVALAPIAYTSHMKSPVTQLAAKLYWLIDILAKLFNVNELFPYNKSFADLKVELTQENTLTQTLAIFSLFLQIGFDFPQIDKYEIPVVYSEFPSTASIKTIKQFAQFINSGKFRKYDYGLIGNLKHYGRINPPTYDLSKITAPVYVQYGKNDWLDAEKDIEKIVSELPNVRVRAIPYDKFNHFDFIWALNIVSELNNDILNAFKNYTLKFDNKN